MTTILTADERRIASLKFQIARSERWARESYDDVRERDWHLATIAKLKAQLTELESNERKSS